MGYSRVGLSLLAVVLLWALAASPSRAVDPPDRWTVDDLVDAESVSGWSVSPDGTSVVWVRSTVAEVADADERVSNLWMSRLDDGDSYALTRGVDRETSPRFSPDGSHLAFLSTRLPPDGDEPDEDAAPQLWALAVGRGEAFPVSRLERPVEDFRWIDDDTLLLAAAESRSEWEAERDEADDTTVVVDDAAHEPPVRLFVATLDGTVRRLTTNDDWIDALAVSPDGRRAVVTAQRSLSYEFDQKVRPWTYMVDVESGAMTRLFADGDHLPTDVRWAPDGRGFYFLDERTHDPVYRTATVTALYYCDADGGAAERVDGDWERGVGDGYAPLPDGVAVLLADGVRDRPVRYRRHGGAWRRQDLVGTHAANLDRWEVSPDGGRVVYSSSSIDRPPQLWGARLEGGKLTGEVQLSDLNADWAKKPTGRHEVLHWSGARGDTVEGLLHYPLDWKDGERRPLVLDIHGGPAGADTDRWSASWHDPDILWRQRGALVLQVNYHGSSNYGLDWVESIRGHYYELEIPDIEAGVDLVVERGLADPERLAVTGWSNGGILSAELITRTRRYRAAVVGAADVEWASDWANVDFGASFDNYYFGGPPWEIPQVYLDKSPFYRLAEVTTPTLVHTGTEDRNVPPHQSWSLFRALQQIGKAEARLVLYPGEPHGLRQLAHQRRKIEEDAAWLDRHLFATYQPPNEALAEGSLLRAVVERARAARQGAAFGTTIDGVLVPETVAHGELEVGRFEVTRAQLAAADPEHPAAPGSENLPAAGVSFDAAKSYVAWLARVTGRPFRLPTREEAEALAAAAGDGGNTLDHWAGYTPNPEDARRLLAALEATGEEAPLLLPVASFPGTGEPVLFDLDGNVAEWAVGKDGGVAVGPSADRSTDPSGAAAPAAAYVGLRVVVGEAPGS